MGIQPQQESAMMVDKKKRTEDDDDEPDEDEDLPDFPRRRRALDPFSFGWDVDEEFEQMRRYMDQMMKAAMRGGLTGAGANEPFVYGFSLRVGPDGKPVVQEFGNTSKARRIAPQHSEGSSTRGRAWAAEDDDEGTGPPGREPLTDVIDCGDTIAVTMELPGIEKDDIKLEIADQLLTIRVNTEARRYFKEVNLPAPVKEEAAKASYKNGILDITLTKKVPPKKKGTRIEVK
jgi:HSP20 family protein